jgi:hypothetical protein
MANTYLTRTPSAGNRKTFTISCWVKRSGLGSPQKAIFTAGDDSSSPLNFFGFNTNDQIAYWEYSNDTTGISDFLTTRRFRDTNAWYHIVLAVDTTQATASNRIKLYVNGVQETDVVTGGNNLYPQTQNQDLAFNDADGHYVGRYGYSSDSYFDGLMSHFHFIDGTAYDASTFGSTDSTTGEWKINTSPSITMGTNGFTILKDGNTITDQSSNSNDFTLGGGTLTKTEDCPSNVFATLNPLQTNLTTLHNGNCSAGTTSSYQWGMSTLAVNSGKWYVEMKVTHACMVMGIQDIGKANDRLIVNGTFWTSGSQSYHLDGFSKFTHDSYGDISSDASAYPSYGSGDIVMMALDLDNNKLAYGKNGTWYNSTNPGSGTTNMVSIDAPSSNENGNYGIVFGDTCGASDGDFEINFGNGFFGTTAISSEGTNASGIGKFEYDVPTGYTALSTKGLNE